MLHLESFTQVQSDLLHPCPHILCIPAKQSVTHSTVKSKHCNVQHGAQEAVAIFRLRRLGAIFTLRRLGVIFALGDKLERSLAALLRDLEAELRSRERRRHTCATRQRNDTWHASNCSQYLLQYPPLLQPTSCSCCNQHLAPVATNICSCCNQHLLLLQPTSVATKITSAPVATNICSCCSQHLNVNWRLPGTTI